MVLVSAPRPTLAACVLPAKRRELAQDLEGGHNIADTGKVFDGTFICRENGGRQNCHSGILGAADNDIAVQGLAPMNHKLFQAATLLLG